MTIIDATPKLINRLKDLTEISEILPFIPPELTGTTANGAPCNPSAAGEFNIQAVGAPSVWNTGNTGQGVTVGIADSGVRVTHSSLSGNYVGAPNHGWYDPEIGTTTPVDTHGHGTHVAGTAVGGNGIGVAPGANWLACRMCFGFGCTTNTAALCLQFMIAPTEPDGVTNPNGNLAPQVVVNSWSFGRGNSHLNGVLLCLRLADIIPVFANGNGVATCGSARYPAENPLVIAVGNLARVGASANYKIQVQSLLGPASAIHGGGIKPDISAPGTAICSANCDGNNLYHELTGTSMACPNVGGVIALLLSQFPAANYNQVYAAISNSANTLNLVGGGPACSGIASNVFPNNVFGFGMINAPAAFLNMPPVNPPQGCHPGFYRTFAGCRDTCPEGQIFKARRHDALYECVFECNKDPSNQKFVLTSDGKACVPRCADGEVLIGNEQCANACPGDKLKQPSPNAKSDFRCVNSCGSGYRESSDKKTCIRACPVGQYHVNSPKRCVHACPNARPFISVNEASCLLNCGTKFISSDRKRCLLHCPAGEYENKSGGIKECVTSCPKGKKISATNNHLKCKAVCNAALDLIESSDGLSCVNACPPDEVKALNSNACAHACGDNEYLSSNGRHCVDKCGLNELISSDEKSCVETCPAGEVIAKNDLQCLDTCPDGDLLSSDHLSCVDSCEPDEFLTSNQCECTRRCPRGEFISSTGKECLHTCPDTELINIKNTHCVKACEADQVVSSDTLRCTKRCEKGEFYSADEKSCCIRCDPKEWVSVDGIKCIPLCPIGSFGITYGKYARTCQLCATGTYSDVAGSLECDRCPPGLTTAGYGSKSLTDCFCPNVPIIKKYSSKDDCDQDGVADNCDNCKYVPNPKQTDLNKNQIGDVCEKKKSYSEPYPKSYSKPYPKRPSYNAYSKYRMLLDEHKSAMSVVALLLVAAVAVVLVRSTKEDSDSQLYAPLTPY